MSAMKRTHFFWALVGTAALLASPARVALGADGERSWRPATNNALEFGILGGRLTDLDGGMLSLRRQHGRHAVWRFGLELGAVRSRSKTSLSDTSAVQGVAVVIQDDFRLAAQVTRLSFPWPERRLRPWFGLALGGGTTRHGYESAQPDFTYSAVTGGPYVYGAALAGLEYAITPRFAVHAQYGQGVQYTDRRDDTVMIYGTRGTNDGSTSNWQLYSTGARFGLAVFY